MMLLLALTQLAEIDHSLSNNNLFIHNVFWNTGGEVDSLELDLEEVKPFPRPDPSKMHERWIIVTTIFAPNQDIKLLAKIPGWKLLVIGDLKTPSDWRFGILRSFQLIPFSINVESYKNNVNICMFENNFLRFA